MAQEIHISMMQGGLDLVTAPIVMEPGKVIAASNYEPDVNGYTSSGGFERFDGKPAPSSGTTPEEIDELRSLIGVVPGTGPVRGVWVYDGYVYAFRDQEDGSEGMYRADNGWQEMSFGYKLQFGTGSSEFTEGEYIVGFSSSATARVDRIVLREGSWDAGTAAGYLVISNVTGTFTPLENITSTAGDADLTGAEEVITIRDGGHYDFTNHNFYGAQGRSRMYFVSGTDTAFEWDGEFLVPIFTGITGAGDLEVVPLLAPIQLATYPTERPVYALPLPDDPLTELPVIMSSSDDSPAFIAHYKNHLMLGYSSGALINSSIGEPLLYSTTTGAGEMDFGDQLTGLLAAASTALVAFAQNRIEYLTGSDSDSFELNAITDTSGAHPYTIQMMDEPMFLDDGGVHKASTTSAFGDWRMGSVTQQIEPLIEQKRSGEVHAVASLRIKAKDQYKLFWEDGSGITVYIGRKNPETLPFKLPVEVFCTCSGETDFGRGERLFIGCQDGYVYEMNKGTSFDGVAIDSYIRLPFNAAKSPAQQTRWQKATFEIASPDAITVGVAFDVDYARGLGGAAVDVGMDAGSAIITTELWGDVDVDWSQPVEGRLEKHLQGIGPNIAATLIHSSATARQHTIQSQTYNFSRRGMKR